MPRKWCLNAIFLVGQFMVLVHSEETCIWCDKDIREKFTECWYDKIIQNPIYTNMPISSLEDLKSKIIIMSEEIQERLDEMINNALVDEIKRLLQSVAELSDENIEEVTEEMMNDIRSCYVEVSGNPQVYLIYNIRDLIEMMLNNHQPEDMDYISEQKGNLELEQYLSNAGNEYNLDASGNETSTYPPEEWSTLSDTDRMDKKKSEILQTLEVSISSSNNSKEKISTDNLYTDDIIKAKKFSEALFVALLKSNLFRKTFARTISKDQAQYLAFKMAFHAITNYGYSEYANEIAYACATSIKSLPKISTPQAFGGKISKAITSIFYRKGLIQENTREQARHLASEMLNFLSNIISVQSDSDSLMLNLTPLSSWTVGDKQDANHDNEAYTQIVIKGKESKNKDYQRNYETSGTAAGKSFYAALLNLLQSSPYVSYVFNEITPNLKESSLAAFEIRNALQSDYGDEIANKSAKTCKNALSKIYPRPKASALLKCIVNCLTIMLDKYDLISADKTFQQAIYIGNKINKSLYDILKNIPALQEDEQNRIFNHSLFTDSKEKKDKIQEPEIAYNYIQNTEASMFTNLSFQTEKNDKSNRTDYFPMYNSSLLKDSTESFVDSLQQSSTESSIGTQQQPDSQAQNGQIIIQEPHIINYPDDYYSNYGYYADYYYSDHHYLKSDKMALNHDEQSHQYTSTNCFTEPTELKFNLQTQGEQKTVQKSQIINDKQYNYPNNDYLSYFNDYNFNYDFSNEEYYSKDNYLDDYYSNYYNPFYNYYYSHYPESEEIISYNVKQQLPYTDRSRSNSESSSNMKQELSLQTQEQQNFQKPQTFNDIQYNYYDYSDYYYFDNYHAKYDYSYQDFKNYYFNNYFNYPEVYQPDYTYHADNYDTTYNEEHINQDPTLDYSVNKLEEPKTLQLNLQQRYAGDKLKQFSDKSENPEPWAAANDYNSDYWIYDFYNENYEMLPQNNEQLHQYKNTDYHDIGLELPENLQLVLQLLGGFNRKQFPRKYENPVLKDYYYLDDYKNFPHSNVQLYNFINSARILEKLEPPSMLQQKNLDHIFANEYYPHYYNYDYNSNYYAAEGFQTLHDEEKLQYHDVNRPIQPEVQHTALQSQEENSEYKTNKLNPVEFFRQTIFSNTSGKDNNYKNNPTTATNHSAENNYKFYHIGQKTKAQNEISFVKNKMKQIPILPITQKNSTAPTRLNTSKKLGKVNFLQTENNDITKNQDPVLPNSPTEIFPTDKPKENNRDINQIENERKLENISPELSSNSKMEHRMKILMDTAKTSATSEKFDYKSLASIMSSVAITIKHEHPDWDSETLITQLLIETLVACTQLLVHNNEKNSKNIERKTAQNVEDAINFMEMFLKNSTKSLNLFA